MALANQVDNYANCSGEAISQEIKIGCILIELSETESLADAGNKPKKRKQLVVDV